MNWLRLNWKSKKCKDSGESFEFSQVLLESAIQPEVDAERFDRKLFRLHHVSSVKRTATYWSPAIFGAGVAAVALLAVLQLISQSSTIKPIKTFSSESAMSRSGGPIVLPISENPNSSYIR
ncbi:MAG: hypothetical protein J0L72_04305 [Armatimonadetes bacterium]|nr:hypothetical protein [Armatimonadota bacterium]